MKHKQKAGPGAVRRHSRQFRGGVAVRLVAGLIALGLIAPALAAQTGDPEDLASLSLEELANMRVTSVSKRAESLGDAAASIYVISSESIRRAGVATVPEALRLAPNLQVARVDARNYAVTARGFNSPFENKLLVLIDGRSVYTPLFSGVFWDAQDVVLADVERIEVISGPGATLWGANAVNGVINIITKSAGATQGLLAGAGFDREMRSGVLRYGGALGGGGRYRVYAKALQGDDLPREGLATPSLTGWRRSQLGFRADWGSAEDLFTVQGDAYAGALHQQGTADIRIGGANLLARKSQRLASGQELTAQVYLDHTERNQPLAFIEHLDTLDLQLQSAMTPFERHRLVVGAGYRVANDSLQNGAGFAFLPAEEKLHWGNVFVEDEIDLNDQLRLVAGVKFEHNNYTGTEFLPTLRLAYKPTGASLLWGALSRTVRAPSRIDRDLYSPSQPAVVAGVPQFAIGGGPGFQSEVAEVAELGYRVQALPALSLSATAFVSRYQRLRTLEPSPNGVGSVFANLASGRNKGVEMWGSWQAGAALRLDAGLVAQRVDTALDARSRDASGATGLATSDPSHYWSLRAALDIADGHSIDLMYRRYGKLDRPAVPAYGSLDLNYIWRLRPSLEFSVQGSNLLTARHVEFGGVPGRILYERKLGARLVWRR